MWGEIFILWVSGIRSSSIGSVVLQFHLQGSESVVEELSAVPKCRSFVRLETPLSFRTNLVHLAQVDTGVRYLANLTLPVVELTRRRIGNPLDKLHRRGCDNELISNLDVLQESCQHDRKRRTALHSMVRTCRGVPLGPLGQVEPRGLCLEQTILPR